MNPKEPESAVQQCVLVTLPFNSQKGFATPDSKWRPAAELGLIINEAVYPRIVHTDYVEPMTVAGRSVLLARLFRLDRLSGYLELSIEADDVLDWDQKQQLVVYQELVTFQDQASHPVFAWAAERLGGDARLAWHFTINLVSQPCETFQPDRFQALIGPLKDQKDCRGFSVGALQSIVMAETGGWACMSPGATDAEYAQARFWLSRVQVDYSSIQFLLQQLMEQRRKILRGSRLTPAEFDRFLRLKQLIVGLIVKISPGANAAGWLDIQIYPFCYRAWDMDEEKQNLLEVLDRLEGIVENLEERRRRKSSFLLSILVNIITITGLFAVLDYFINFSGRHGINMALALGIERQAVFAIIVLISGVALLLTIRNR